MMNVDNAEGKISGRGEFILKLPLVSTCTAVEESESAS
jgi:hypothetical protein